MKSKNVLSPTREGQIARKILKKIYHEKGIPHLDPRQLKREISKMARVLDVSRKELMKFYENFIRELVDEAFSKK